MKYVCVKNTIHKQHNRSIGTACTAVVLGVAGWSRTGRHNLDWHECNSENILGILHWSNTHCIDVGVTSVSNNDI
jgi:hypothetical protein